MEDAQTESVINKTISKIVLGVSGTALLAVFGGLITWSMWRGGMDVKVDNLMATATEIRQKLDKIESAVQSLERTREYYHGKDGRSDSTD